METNECPGSHGTSYETGWIPVASRHLPAGFSIENLCVVFKKGDSYRDAIIREIDLSAMITDGVLLEVHKESNCCYAYVKIPEGYQS